PVTAANSLVGTATGDLIGFGGVVALTNGNYVVRSLDWNGGAANEGAVTWGNGATGLTGTVSAANSLVGTSAADSVGDTITALANGNYVVASPDWDNGAVANVGAVTWGNGTTGTTGAVSAANSLVGTTAGDTVGNSGVVALANGNYVVRSTLWDNNGVMRVGAVTWGNGATGITGPVTASNSLVGTTADDRVGLIGVTALANGNYVVVTSTWDNGMLTDAGAATFGNGATGIRGPVTAANSLVGQTAAAGLQSVVADAVNGQFYATFPSESNGIVRVAASAGPMSPPPPPPPPPTGGHQPAPLAASGLPNGSAALFPPAPGGPLAATPTATLAPFGGIGADVRTAVADVDGDGVPDTILVTGPGTPLRVAVVSGKDNTTLLVPPFDPFGGDFTGGGFVAAADLDHDGRAEFVVTPDQGGGPRVTVFSLGTDGSVRTRANFLGIDDPNFRGGARAAVGDVDGTPDVVVAAGFGGGPRAAIFTGASVLAGTPTRLVGDFFAFPGSDAQTLRNGAFVAAGDVDGDGKADLIFGGGPGGAPRVFVLSGALIAAGDTAGAYAAPLGNFFVAGDQADRGGVHVGAVDADGDGRADVAVGSGAGDPARVRVYPGTGFTGGGEPGSFQDLTPFGGTVLADGVYVG
ncbi:MAG TPA: FG-GAP-like repeat-containing protein, partial [Urbifossiella sp.]|nr:FG-GAP-like repeat-containing protein [Urbifossiella sp.]